MGRPVVLSNGELFVGLDENGLVHDFYYPYVGQENLTNERSVHHKVGVWVNGTFSWTDDGSWETNITFEADALVSEIVLHSKDLLISIRFRDFVDPKENIWVRRAVLTNHATYDQEVRLFMHQVFLISRGGRADTAFYVPEDEYIYDYKGQYGLLIGGKTDENTAFDQYAIGNYGIEGKAGTYMDAEDGELSGNPIEHGGVDSVLRFTRIIKPAELFGVDYWIVAAHNQTDAQKIHQNLMRTSMDDRLQNVRTHFMEWLDISRDKLSALPERRRLAAQKSLLVIKAHCDKRGSVLASGDSSIFNYGRDYYCYCWPRDAAFAIWPLIRLGYFEEAKNFFAFARDTMHPDGYMMHKYQPDRSIGSTWHPLLHGKTRELAIQEDETAIVLFMIGEYFKTSQDQHFVEEYYDSFIAPCAKFLTQFVDQATGLPHASYDLWEQKFLTSTYSASTAIAGLETSAVMAQKLGHNEDAEQWHQAAMKIRGSLDGLYNSAGYFRKGLLLQADGEIDYDDTLDASSLYGPFMFAHLPLDDKRLRSTAEKVENRLLGHNLIGGVIRYEGDGYFLAKQQYPGNPWAVCTLWLAQYYLSAGSVPQANYLINWVMERMSPSGMLSEQYDPESGESLGVTPLVWSHAELLNTLIDSLETKA